LLLHLFRGFSHFNLFNFVLFVVGQSECRQVPHGHGRSLHIDSALSLASGHACRVDDFSISSNRFRVFILTGLSLRLLDEIVLRPVGVRVSFSLSVGIKEFPLATDVNINVVVVAVLSGLGELECLLARVICLVMFASHSTHTAELGFLSVLVLAIFVGVILAVNPLTLGKLRLLLSLLERSSFWLVQFPEVHRCDLCTAG